MRKSKSKTKSKSKKKSKKKKEEKKKKVPPLYSPKEVRTEISRRWRTLDAEVKSAYTSRAALASTSVYKIIIKSQATGLCPLELNI